MGLYEPWESTLYYSQCNTCSRPQPPSPQQSSWIIHCSRASYRWIISFQAKIWERWSCLQMLNVLLFVQYKEKNTRYRLHLLTCFKNRPTDMLLSDCYPLQNGESYGLVFTGVTMSTGVCRLINGGPPKLSGPRLVLNQMVILQPRCDSSSATKFPLPIPSCQKAPHVWDASVPLIVTSRTCRCITIHVLYLYIPSLRNGSIHL